MSAPPSDQSLLQEYLDYWKTLGVETLSPRFEQLKTQLSAAGKHVERSVSPGQIHSLGEVRQWIGDCKRCGLCEARNKIVFGRGADKTPLLFVGEGPGADEDAEGEPFVGKAGQLLAKIIEAMGLKQDEVYITNVVKCRPPGNRVPSPDEIAQCYPFLKAQINLIQPKMIVALGLIAATTLTEQAATMGALRGKLHTLPWHPDIEVLPTYHPAYLLRNPDAKSIVWEDMKLVLKKLGKTS